LKDAIARELKEETGYTFDNYIYLGKTSANPSTHNNWMHFFLASGGELTGEQQLDQNEEIELVLLSLEEVKDLLKKQEVMQSMHVTALFYALHKLGELNW
jgi:ADP-ribose pyrophosphatase